MNMKRTLEALAGIAIFILYIWYRIALCLIFTKPILSLDKWVQSNNIADLQIMFIFALTIVGLIFIPWWAVIGIYLSLLIINILVYAIYRTIRRNR